MTKFKKNASGNYKGRPKGAKNKTTTQIKELIIQFVGAEIGTIREKYKLIAPDKQLSFLKELIGYVIPRATPEIMDFSKLTDEEINIIVEKLLNK